MSAYDPTSSVYLLAERIARAETQRGIEEGRVRNAISFERKVRDNMLERVQQRGTGWLVEQGIRWDCDIPDDLAQHKPTREERQRKQPTACPTCGVFVRYDPARRIRMIDEWPYSVSNCALGYALANCHEYHHRGDHVATQQIVAAHEAAA